MYDIDLGGYGNLVWIATSSAGKLKIRANARADAFRAIKRQGYIPLKVTLLG
jgi:hypothetical protein